MAPRRWLLVALVVAVVVCGAPAAVRAQGTQPDRAAAQTLFDQAVALREQGAVERACGKFEESLRLDQAVGTRFNLADCLERIGKLASAWSHFLQVAADTEVAGQTERAEVARARAKRLEPRLARLRINVPQNTPGLELQRDGMPVGSAQWSTAIPVDLGRHALEASAPGKRTWSKSVVIGKEGQLVRVVVPPLDEAPSRAGGGDDGTEIEVTSPGMSSAQIAGLVVAGIGLAGAGVGAGFGLVAMSKKSEVDDLCPDLNRCTEQGIAVNDQAKTAGTVSTVGFIAGGALMAGGLITWLAAPGVDEGGAAVALTVAPIGPAEGSGGMALLGGRW